MKRLLIIASLLFFGVQLCAQTTRELIREVETLLGAYAKGTPLQDQIKTAISNVAAVNPIAAQDLQYEAQEVLDEASTKKTPQMPVGTHTVPQKDLGLLSAFDDDEAPITPEKSPKETTTPGTETTDDPNIFIKGLFDDAEPTAPEEPSIESPGTADISGKDKGSLPILLSLDVDEEEEEEEDEGPLPATPLPSAPPEEDITNLKNTIFESIKKASEENETLNHVTTELSFIIHDVNTSQTSEQLGTAQSELNKILLIIQLLKENLDFNNLNSVNQNLIAGSVMEAVKEDDKLTTKDIENLIQTEIQTYMGKDDPEPSAPEAEDDEDDLQLQQQGAIGAGL